MPLNISQHHYLYLYPFRFMHFLCFTQPRPIVAEAPKDRPALIPGICDCDMTPQEEFYRWNEGWQLQIGRLSWVLSWPNVITWVLPGTRRRQKPRSLRCGARTGPMVAGSEDGGCEPWTNRCDWFLESGSALSWEPARKWGAQFCYGQETGTDAPLQPPGGSTAQLRPWPQLSDTQRRETAEPAGLTELWDNELGLLQPLNQL